MDFRRPVSSLVPGATGRILEVLARSTSPLNVSTVARLARVSPSQASRVLPRLADLGVASMDPVPPSSLYSLDRDNLVAHVIESLLASPEKAVERLRSLASRIKPTPASVVLFGSAARGTATASSDLDVLVVRPAIVEDGDEGWNSSLQSWSDRAQRLTGNAVNILEVDETELSERLAADSAIWQDIALEGRTVYGRDLETYIAHR